MGSALRDALTAAAADSPPASTVDVDAALAIGRRRRTRKMVAVSVAGIWLVAVVMLAPNLLVSKPDFTMPVADDCMDAPLLQAARAVLPPVGTWTPANGPQWPCADYGVRRLFMLVTDRDGTGSFAVTLSPSNTGPPESGGQRRPLAADVVQTVPEGDLRQSFDAVPWPSSQSGGSVSETRRARAVLNSRDGQRIEVEASNCSMPPQPPPGSYSWPACLAQPPYTTDQLADLAVLIARSGQAAPSTTTSPAPPTSGPSGTSRRQSPSPAGGPSPARQSTTTTTTTVSQAQPPPPAASTRVLGALWEDRNGNGNWEQWNDEAAMTGSSGAVVSLDGPAGFHREAVVDSRGWYEFPDVPAGTYTVRAPDLSATGYRWTAQGQQMAVDTETGESKPIEACCGTAYVSFIGYAPAS
jgi:hypothetical protein